MTPADPVLSERAGASVDGQLVERVLSLGNQMRTLRGTASEEEVLDAALRILRETLGYPTYCLLLSPRSGERLVLRASPGAPPIPSQTLLAWALQKGTAVATPIGPGRCWILAPLMAEGACLGVLGVAADSAEDAVPRIELELVDSVAREAAGTIAQLRERARSGALRDLFDHIVESVPHGILALSRDDRVIACNRNFEFLFGLRRVAILDAPYRDVFPKPLADLVAGLIASTLSGRQIVDHEYLHRLPEGPEVQVGFSTTLLRGDRGPEGILFLCRDLALSREVQKLRELDVLKTEFVHTVSHELKTPLTAILGGTELLLADAASLSADQREVVGFIEQGGRRLQALIADLLDLSRLEAGSVTLDRTPVSLPELANEALGVARAAHPQCAADVRVPPSFPLLMLDRAKMQQVLQNLLSNAFKYSPKGGTVRVRFSVAGTQATVEVADEGIGIAPEHLERIWEKFYRVDSSTTASIEGTGLGLPIVKHLVEMHDGRVEVESEPGRGSTFRVHLPLTDGAEAPPP